jgi:hypothetical protein
MRLNALSTRALKGIIFASAAAQSEWLHTERVEEVRMGDGEKKEIDSKVRKNVLSLGLSYV